MKLVRDVCNNKDIIAVEVGDNITLDNIEYYVDKIIHKYNKRVIILKNKLGDTYIVDDRLLQGIIY